MDDKHREAFDKDPKYNGQLLIECTVCNHQMKPMGRDAPISTGPWCIHQFGPTLWPEEKREDYGYPVDLAEESARLRKMFYPEENTDNEQV